MLPLFAIVLPAIVLFCGLCLDVGLIELKQLQLQSAADAAALGAELEAERGTGNWINIATLDAGVNGFVNGQNNVTVTVAQKATFGAYAGRYDAIQATITQTIKTIFMGTLNGGSVTLTAQGVSVMTPCLYLTGTGALQQYSLDVQSGSVNANSCPVYVNTSMRVQAYGKMAVEAINVAGAASGSVLAGSVVYPPPYFNVPTMADPLASVTQPPYTGCVYNTGYNVSNNSNATLSPTSYCNGLTFSNSTVSLSPGTYFITGTATWTNSTVTGTGVTLFFTHDAGGAYRGLQVSNSTVTLSAPTAVSSPYQGIVVFTDRAWVPHNPPQDFQLTNSNVTTDGIWYLTGTGLAVSSCLAATAAAGNCTLTGNNYFGVIADNMLVNGTIFTPLNNYSNLSTGNPLSLLGPLVQ
jgi:hypothetical protein